jgi:transcriptional regulator with GAF, ATPase, and Fis domain
VPDPTARTFLIAPGTTEDRMPTCTAWFRACGCADLVASEIQQELSAAGINLVPLDDAGRDGRFGIVCFAEISEELFSILALGGSGFRLILAVAVSPAQTAIPVWQLLQAGASDALAWDEQGVAAKQIGAKLARWSKIDALVSEACSMGFFVGESPAWRALVRKVVEAAHFTTAPILLTGESGTGKELLARLVSNVTRANDSTREPRRELVTVDCGTLLPELSGSEFFGHERGAFTGAHTTREGAFSMANGATLLLDEIGDIPLILQAQILRSIQEKTYKRLGGNVWYNTNYRLVSATNRDLEQMVERGQFRLDLYYRIAGCILRTPPLRERREDILPLVRHFLTRILERPAPDLDDCLSEYLINRPYPGNVRELLQLIQRLAIRYPGIGPVTAGDLPEDDRPAAGTDIRAWPDARFEESITQAVMLGASLKEISQVATRTAVRIAVAAESGNLQRAAQRLRVTDRAVQMRRAAGELGHKQLSGIPDSSLRLLGERRSSVDGRTRRLEAYS